MVENLRRCELTMILELTNDEAEALALILEVEPNITFVGFPTPEQATMLAQLPHTIAELRARLHEICPHVSEWIRRPANAETDSTT